jgi:hypothetical protein
MKALGNAKRAAEPKLDCSLRRTEDVPNPD